MLGLFEPLFNSRPVRDTLPDGLLRGRRVDDNRPFHSGVNGAVVRKRRVDISRFYAEARPGIQDASVETTVVGYNMVKELVGIINRYCLTLLRMDYCGHEDIVL